VLASLAHLFPSLHRQLPAILQAGKQQTESDSQLTNFVHEGATGEAQDAQARLGGLLTADRARGRYSAAHTDEHALGKMFALHPDMAQYIDFTWCQETVLKKCPVLDTQDGIGGATGVDRRRVVWTVVQGNDHQVRVVWVRGRLLIVHQCPPDRLDRLAS
jgi:hypothetical protein